MCTTKHKLYLAWKHGNILGFRCERCKTAIGVGKLELYPHLLGETPEYPLQYVQMSNVRSAGYIKRTRSRD